MKNKINNNLDKNQVTKNAGQNGICEMCKRSCKVSGKWKCTSELGFQKLDCLSHIDVKKTLWSKENKKILVIFNNKYLYKNKTGGIEIKDLSLGELGIFKPVLSESNRQLPVRLPMNPLIEDKIERGDLIEVFKCG